LGVREVGTTSGWQRFKEIEREFKELRRANESSLTTTFYYNFGYVYFRPGGSRAPTQILKDLIETH
jgi:hypothetical protein